MAGSQAAAFLRQRQAIFGDALVILGGGTGVEHSADLYLSRRLEAVRAPYQRDEADPVFGDVLFFWAA